MASRRCPRCDAALNGRSVIHLRCVLTRTRFMLGSALLVALVIGGVGAEIAILLAH